MLFLEDQTLSGTSKCGCKLSFTAHGRWSAPDVVRGVATLISQRHKGRIDAPLMLDIISIAEKTVVDLHGEAFSLPKTEPEVSQAKKADTERKERIWAKINKVFWLGFTSGGLVCGLFNLGIKLAFG